MKLSFDYSQILETLDLAFDYDYMDAVSVTYEVV